MRFLARFLAAGFALAVMAHQASADPRTIRIGYQKYGTLVYEKARGTLEKRLAPLGVTVTWTEFLGGPALMEAMGAGSVDFGIAGDAPPIFAQAAGVNLVYTGVEPASPHSEGMIVLDSSPAHTVADLKGKRIALNRGSNVHNLLVRVLEANGMTMDDIHPIYLKPSDARAAFESGDVDAWVIWDPYLAAAETADKTRLIADGMMASGKTIDENREFFLAAKDFYRANPDIMKIVMADLADTEKHASENRPEVVRLLAPEMRMDPAAVKLSIDRLSFGVLPIDSKIIASQQDIADVFTKLGLIPVKIDVREARPQGS